MNAENNNPVIWFITKKEFKRRVALINTDLFKISLKYAELLEKTKQEKKRVWIIEQISQIRQDMEFNNSLMQQADIENGFVIFWLDETGNPGMRRCTQEEYRKTYKKKETRFVI